jgi:hypothetical protein
MQRGGLIIDKVPVHTRSRDLELHGATLALDIRLVEGTNRRFRRPAIGHRTIEHGVAYDAAARLGM